MGSPDPLSWRPLADSDLPALTDLAGACLAADGGQPFAATTGFCSQCYLSGAQSLGGFDGPRLVCASSLRRRAADLPGDGPGQAGVTTGLVHPAWRRRGIGGHAFDWAAERSGPGKLLAESEALSEGAHALYLGKGLSLRFAELVMTLPAGTEPPAARPAAGLVLSEWGEAGPARFFAVYEAAFRERPGFPGWSQAQWTGWIHDDDYFRPAWTLLASLGGADVAYIAAEATGWIAQVGVVPSARGRDLGALLIGEAVRRMRAAGETDITLNVNVNNPRAIALYRRLGFTTAGRRARYERGI